MTAAAARVALCWAVFTACLCVMGCAGNGRPGASAEGPGWARTATGESPAPQTAINRVVLGKSSRADVEAALGKAIVIPFDSGYEVWVYRWPGADTTPRAATEVVVLFDPSGLATKARLRPGYEPSK